MRRTMTLSLIALLLAASLLAGCASVDSITSSLVESDSTMTTTAESTEFEGDHDDPADYVWDAADEILVSLEGDSISTDAAGAATDGGTIRLTQAGTYRITGTLDDGQIIVDTASEETVRLVLDDVDITCADSSPIYVASGEKVVVILEDGTQNTLTDGAEYDLVDAEEGEPNGVIFSKADLTIAGDGSLVVTGEYADGIVSKDGLIINGGDITVAAVDDAIRGTDYVVVKDGLVDVTAGAMGLKSTEFVLIEGGDITVDATGDAIHSDNSVAISDGSLLLATGDDAVHADVDLWVGGGTIDVTESYEGLESGTITIDDGDITIVASNDGLNAAGGVDGSGEVTADGTTADDTFSRRGNGGGGDAGATGDYYIYINGGTIVIESEGDGIDSNGYVTMTGGTVIIHGPTGTSGRAEGAIDYGWTFELSGGVLVAVDNGSRESKVVDSLVDQAAIRIVVDGVVSAGTLIHVETADGESVLTFESAKDFAAMSFSSPELEAGTEYNVYVDGTATGSDIGGLYDASAYEAGTLAFTIEAYN
ncbi:MAG: carbohydrate-binding domain-containing protein [Coriobacteriia bacterium]|nr:carbohydrate-binding domain-containing protein [Coriobacteriia bacterium]